MIELVLRGVWRAGVGEEQPSGGTGDGGLEVFGQASAATEPGEGALDHPSAGEQVKAFDAGRALDDLDRPGSAWVDRFAQLRPAVDAVSEDVSQVGEALAQGAQERDGAVR